jgi:hypothetical protein
MKKSHIFTSIVAVVILFAMATQTSFARKPSADKPAYMEQLNKVVKESVKYPDFKLNKAERGDIFVTFTLTDDGKIKVEKVEAPSPRVEEYIKAQLSDVPCKDIIHPYNQAYKVKFRFENI